MILLRRPLTWILAIVFASWIAYLFYFFLSKDNESFLDANIPEETKDFFRNLARRSNEIYIDFVEKIEKEDYDNNKDFGNDPVNNFLILEDENFIIYFRDVLDEDNRARKTQEYAKMAIEPLTDFFGIYYYPHQLKGRRLSIYLAASNSDYHSIAKDLGWETPGWSIGATFMRYSRNGDNICYGILISEQAQVQGENDLRELIFHEMAHFVHLQSINITLKSEIYDWECEGIATYFAGEIKIVPDEYADPRMIELDKQQEDYLNSYWIGNTVFRYLSSVAGEDGVHEIIQGSYDKSIFTPIENKLGINQIMLQENWRDYCRSYSTDTPN